MTDEKALPFHSFTFTLLENRQPRASFRLVAAEDELYNLQVQRGSAANPTTQFERKVPLEAAERLRDSLQAIGAFGWEDTYGDETTPGSRRWTLSVVFKEGVFSLESKGGSDVPPGFDQLLEELYRMDFPRPTGRAAHTPSPRAAAPTSIGDLAAFASEAGLPDISGLDPAELEKRLLDEVRHMSPAERNRLIDALVRSGMGTRQFWEDFFRGLS